MRYESGKQNRRTVLKAAAVVLLPAAVIGLLRFAGVGTGVADPPRDLNAATLVDTRWPLDDRFHDELKALQTGRWMVLIVQRDSKPGQDLITRHFSDPRTHRTGERTAVFLADESEWSFRFDSIVNETNGDDSFRWPGTEPSVTEPAVFVLNDGVVVRAADGSEADEFLQDLL